MNAKTLERILILRTIINGGGEMAGKDIADRASTECDHDLLDPLPPISRRGIGQKLQAMSLDGLVAHSTRKSPVIAERVSLWSVTDKGREMAESIGAVTPAAGLREAADAMAAGIESLFSSLPYSAPENVAFLAQAKLSGALADYRALRATPEDVA